VRVRWAFALAALGAALPAGCGSPPGDLFEVTRSGTIPGARLVLLVSDGTVTCNGGEPRALDGERLLMARELRRDLEAPARARLALAPAPGSVLSYRARLEPGVLSFSDSSAGRPAALTRLAAFTRDVAKRVCGLAR